MSKILSTTHSELFFENLRYGDLILLKTLGNEEVVAVYGVKTQYFKKTWADDAICYYIDDLTCYFYSLGKWIQMHFTVSNEKNGQQAYLYDDGEFYHGIDITSVNIVKCKP